MPTQHIVLAASPDDSIFITGPVGSGRTHLACAVLRFWIEAGRADWVNPRWYHHTVETSAEFVSVPELFLRLKAGFDSERREDGEHAVVSRLNAVRALVLDDLGVGNVSAWSLGVLYDVLNHRLDYLMPTVVTSNVGLDKLHEVDPRLASRLGGMVQIELHGKDRRLSRDPERD